MGIIVPGLNEVTLNCPVDKQVLSTVLLYFALIHLRQRHFLVSKIASFRSPHHYRVF